MLQGIGPFERIAIVHTHAPGRIAVLHPLSAHLLPSDDILAVNITPVTGSHIGPGAFGFAVVGA
jgi:hypothetical protein